MKIPTQFTDEMEQAELYSPRLVNIEVSTYPFFLNMKTEISIGSDAKTQTKRGKSYHKTISHRKRVERPEHNGSSFLQAPFEQPDIKSRVI